MPFSCSKDPLQFSITYYVFQLVETINTTFRVLLYTFKYWCSIKQRMVQYILKQQDRYQKKIDLIGQDNSHFFSKNLGNYTTQRSGPTTVKDDHAITP